MTDDEYRGYYLPAGSLVIGNAWSVSLQSDSPVFFLTVCLEHRRSILHDPETYPDPETFKPTRFLTPDGQLDPGAPDPTNAAFGFGRRICPGRFFALESLWISIGYILFTVQIEKTVDEFGFDRTDPTALRSDAFRSLRSFVCCARRRSKRILSVHARKMFV